MQGDRGIVALFERLGVITEFGDEGAELSATPDLYNSLDVDLTDMPDAVPALAITAAMAGIPFKLSGVGALHHKESDRIEALAASLLKLGIVTETTHYGTVFEWDGRRVPITEMPVFDTFGDHRIAMALAPVSVFVPGIVIKNAEVVDKSYPGFGMTCVMPDSFCATPTRIWRKHDCSAHFTCASFRVGVLLWLHDRMTRSDADKQSPAQQQQPEECCGMHITCERDSLLASVSPQIEYYDDEELDAFKGLRPRGVYRCRD